MNRIDALHQAQQVGEETAVEQHVTCVCVRLAQRLIIVIPDQMIDIRRDDISKEIATELVRTAEFNVGALRA